MSTSTNMMKCTIPGVNLKVFGRAIQSLSKIGDELYFEPLSDGLYLRTVNSCRSAYGCFHFSPPFFHHYVNGEPSNRDGTEDSEEEGLRCKLGMKSAMTVFRNLANIDKVVEICRISLDMKEARLIFQLYCRHGMIKTHNLTFIECETLQAVFSKDMCPNKLTTPPKLLCDAVVNFQSNQEEITLIVQPDYLALKNYVEDEPDPKKVIHTELTLSPDEFDSYQVGVDTNITFCLKELRAILGFADVTNLPLSLHFESAGRPVTFSITSDLSFEANFVLATLAEVDSSQVAPVSSQAQPVSSRPCKPLTKSQPRTNVHKRSTSRLLSKQVNRTTSANNNSKPRPQPSSSALDDIDKGMGDGDSDEEISRAMMDVTDQDLNITVDQTRHENRLGSITAADRHKEHHPAMHSASGSGSSSINERVSVEAGHANQIDAQIHKGSDGSHPKNTAIRCENAAKRNNARDDDDDFDDLQSFDVEKSFGPITARPSFESPIVGQRPSFKSPIVGQHKQLSLKSSRSDEESPIIPVVDEAMCGSPPVDELSEGEDAIPGTPPSKKFRSVFFGTQSSTQSSQSQRKAAILAPASDDED